MQTVNMQAPLPQLSSSLVNDMQSNPPKICHNHTSEFESAFVLFVETRFQKGYSLPYVTVHVFVLTIEKKSSWYIL